ncbi:hypothetical protein FPQ18DRAFT_65659 [Pyronema domesticum]|nr:hypothetical protein FPQ18DRAFT_65659 [Pyronema domesticum]
MRTTVSTLDEYAFLNSRPTFETDYGDDNQSESGQSGTSYASSSTSETSGAKKLRVPDPSNEYDGTEFECSYCFKIVENITNKIRWQKHVFGDIRPYVCTYKECPQASHLFERRHDWFHHERDIHRREWICEYGCRNGVFTSQKSF